MRLYRVVNPSRAETPGSLETPPHTAAGVSLAFEKFLDRTRPTVMATIQHIYVNPPPSTPRNDTVHVNRSTPRNYRISQSRRHTKTTVTSFRLGFQSNSFLHFLFLLRGYRKFNCIADTKWSVIIIIFSLCSVYHFQLRGDASGKMIKKQSAHPSFTELRPKPFVFAGFKFPFFLQRKRSHVPKPTPTSMFTSYTTEDTTP